MVLGPRPPHADRDEREQPGVHESAKRRGRGRAYEGAAQQHWRAAAAAGEGFQRAAPAGVALALAAARLRRTSSAGSGFHTTSSVAVSGASTVGATT